MTSCTSVTTNTSLPLTQSTLVPGSMEKLWNYGHQETIFTWGVKSTCLMDTTTQSKTIWHSMNYILTAIKDIYVLIADTLTNSYRLCCFKQTSEKWKYTSNKHYKMFSWSCNLGDTDNKNIFWGVFCPWEEKETKQSMPNTYRSLKRSRLELTSCHFCHLIKK